MERESFSKAKSHLLEKKFVWGWLVQCKNVRKKAVLFGAASTGWKREGQCPAELDVRCACIIHGIRMRSVGTESKPPSWLFAVVETRSSGVYLGSGTPFLGKTKRIRVVSFIHERGVSEQNTDNTQTETTDKTPKRDIKSIKGFSYNLILLFNMNLIFTLAIATSLTGVSTASSLRGVVETFEDQVAVALGGHQKQDVSGDPI